MSKLIRKMTPSDWPSVAAIYLEGIRTGNATFQTEAPTWEEWDKAHTLALPSGGHHRGRSGGMGCAYCQSPRAACTQVWPRRAFMSGKNFVDRALDWNCWNVWWSKAKPKVFGLCRREFSLKISAVSESTKSAGFGCSVVVSGLVRWVAFGGIRFCWNGGVR